MTRKNIIVAIALPSDSGSSRVYKGIEMFVGGGASYLAFTNGAEVIMERQCKRYDSIVFDYDAVNAPEDELPYN